MSDLGGGSGTGSSEQLDRLNTTMMQLLAAMREDVDYSRRTARAIEGNGNLQLGVG
jgi:hypothetical protein